MLTLNKLIEYDTLYIFESTSLSLIYAVLVVMAWLISTFESKSVLYKILLLQKNLTEIPKFYEFFGHFIIRCLLVFIIPKNWHAKAVLSC